MKADALLKIASAIAILAASILIIATIDSNKLTASLGAISVLFAELMIAMGAFTKISGQIKGVIKGTTTMLGLSTSMLILAGALKMIATLDPEQMATGLIGIAGLMTAMVVAVSALGNGGAKVVKGATQMVIFAGAIKILASACTDLTQLDFAGLTKGLIGVGALLAEVSLFINTAKFSGRADFYQLQECLFLRGQ